MPKIPSTKTGFSQVENGTRQIYWEYFGEGKNECIVLLNGVAMAAPSWHRTVPILYPEFDVLLYDYFGQGNSSQEDEPYFINRFADYLIEVMDELGIDKVHPIGVSYGGFIAAELGRLHSNRLHTLIISGILLTRETLFQQYQDLSLMFYKLDEPAFTIYTHYMYEKMFGEDFATRIYGERMEDGRARFYDRYYDRKYCLIRLTEAQNPFFANIDADPNAYTKFQTPTLILTGEQDRALPPWQQHKMTQLIANNHQIILPNSGHMTYMERPEIFWPAVKAFIRAKSTDFSYTPTEDYF